MAAADVPKRDIIAQALAGCWMQEHCPLRRYMPLFRVVLQGEECKLHEPRQRLGGLLPGNDRLPRFDAQRHPQRFLGEAVTLAPIREFSAQHWGFCPRVGRQLFGHFGLIRAWKRLKLQ